MVVVMAVLHLGGDSALVIDGEMIAEHLLPCMAQRAVADVMQQCRGIENSSMLLQSGITAAQLKEGTSGEVEHPQGMGEATGFGPVECEESGAELPDSPQSLESG